MPTLSGFPSTSPSPILMPPTHTPVNTHQVATPTLASSAPQTPHPPPPAPAPPAWKPGMLARRPRPAASWLHPASHPPLARSRGRPRWIVRPAVGRRPPRVAWTGRPHGLGLGVAWVPPGPPCFRCSCISSGGEKVEAPRPCVLPPPSLPCVVSECTLAAVGGRIWWGLDSSASPQPRYSHGGGGKYGT